MLDNPNDTCEDPSEEEEDTKPKLAITSKLKETLSNYHLRLNPRALPADFDLYTFLVIDAGLGNDLETYLPYLGKLPREAQQYINKEFLAYIVDGNDEKLQKLAEGVENFFVVQQKLAESNKKGSSTLSKEEWGEAVNSMAVALRKYYGLREGDQEWPCWNK